MIYPESQADFYSRSWTQLEFDDQMEILTDDETFLGTTDDGGIIPLTIIEKIVAIVKGLLGGTDLSCQQRVEAAWMKLLYYGEAHHLLRDTHVVKLKKRIALSSFAESKTFHTFFGEIENFHFFQKPKATRAECLGKLRAMAGKFHGEHTAILQPGFWTRLTTPPALDPKKLFHFGDTPLQLCQQALDQKKPDLKLVLKYLGNAFDLKNDEPEFQAKLVQYLQKLEGAFPTELKGHAAGIQKWWILLAENGFTNGKSDLAKNFLDRALQADPTNSNGRLQIGRTFLTFHAYTQALPFLPELQKAHAGDPDVLAQVGHAYWGEKQYPQAVAAYDAALLSLQKRALKGHAAQLQMAEFNFKLGIAHLNNLLPEKPKHLQKALHFLVEAVTNDPTAATYLQALLDACIKLWDSDPDQFFILYSQQCLNFITLMPQALLNSCESKIIEIFMGCAQRHFEAHQNEQAHAFLKTILLLYPHLDGLKIKALELAQKYNNAAPLKAQIDKWNVESKDNPVLKMKIGDATWDSSKTVALKAYEEALVQFASRIAATADEAEVKQCQQMMAQIRLRMGQNHLQTQPSLFKGIPYEQALKQLEEAVSLNPAHVEVLFNAYLEAAQAEKKRLLKDLNKVKSYYQKAFALTHKKGDYLVDLLQIYIENQHADDAIALYQDILNQAWASEFVLPAMLYAKLGDAFVDRKDYSAAQSCKREAHLREPTNAKFKEGYASITLRIIKKAVKNAIKAADLTPEKRVEQLLPLANQLKERWEQGFDPSSKIKKEYQTWLEKVYAALAYSQLQVCLIPDSADSPTQQKKVAARLAKKYQKTDLDSLTDNEMIIMQGRLERQAVREVQQEHIKIYRKQIESVLSHYDEALSFNPKNAALHFDKGLLLDYWMNDHAEALTAYDLAVENEGQNPYYNWFLMTCTVAVKPTEQTKIKQLQQAAEQCQYDTFQADRLIFHNEMLFKEKTKQIDPHAYTKKAKGWFG